MAGIARGNRCVTLLRQLSLSVGALFVLLAAESRPAIADDTTAQATPGATITDPDAWRFRATAYGWAMSVSGNLTARGQTIDVDASFIQLIQKSDSLIGYMGYFEADKGPVGFYADLVWARLGFDHSTASYRNPIAGLKISTTTNTALTYSLTIVEAGGLYEIAHWPGSPGSFTAVDGLLGFRYWNNSVDVNLDFSGTVDFSRLGIERGRSFAIAHSGNLDWVDPLIGLRLRHQFTPSQELMVQGDVGGFGFQSTFEWQALGVYSYAWQFSGYQLAGVVGYRALGVNYANGSGINANGANVVLHGPIIGFSVRF
jgi:hypothetical protein